MVDRKNQVVSFGVSVFRPIKVEGSELLEIDSRLDFSSDEFF